MERASAFSMPSVCMGDCIECGDYRLHSSFDNARNFFCGELLASLVSPSVGFAGFNIVWNIPVSCLPTSDTLSVSPDGIRLGDVFLPRSSVSVFKSGWEVGDGFFCPELLRKVGCLLPAAGLSFLINPELRPQSESLFEAALAERAIRAAEIFSSGDLERGVRAMRGIGHGLTPSGDDFLCGTLCAYFVLERVANRDTACERNTVLTNALGGNALSNAFLKAAARGSFSFRQQQFFDAFCSGDLSRVPLAVADVTAVGASSGTDFLVGFLHTMERECVA